MRYTIYFFLLFFSLTSKGQEMYKVELRDSISLDPLSFATVRFEESSRGLVADFNGQFRLPKKLADTLKYLKITSIGYKPLIISTNSLKANKLNVFKVQAQVEQLETVMLKTIKRRKLNVSEYEKKLELNAYNIVKKSVDAIKYNLNDNPHSTIGYYRDYQITEHGEYYNLNEGIVEQFDGGINTNKFDVNTNKSAFYFFERNNNFAIDSLMTKEYNARDKYIKGVKLIPYGGNELMLLNAHNPIRLYDMKSFSFIYRMTVDFLKNHSFSKGNINFIKDEPVINIDVNINEKSDISSKYKVEGQMKISLTDFSIYGFEYKVYESNKSEPTYNILIEYQKIDGKMYMNYMTFNNRFRMRDKNVFRETDLNYDLQDNSLNIEFNKAVDKSSIKIKRFQISYKEEAVDIDKIKFVDSNTIKLLLDERSVNRNLIASKGGDNFNLDIKRIRDINGRKIYKEKNITIYQFREYFVQEVFKNRLPSDGLIFAHPLRPISKSVVNDLKNKNSYILNTPLMNRKL